MSVLRAAFVNSVIRAHPVNASIDRLVGLVVKTSASRAEGPGFDSCLHGGDFSGSNHTSDLKIGTPVATLPGVIGSVLGLVGLVSVYCDWVR